MVQPTRIVGSWAAAEKDALTMTARTVNKHLPIASVPLAGPARTQALPDAAPTLAKIPAGVASIVGVLGARFFLFCKPKFCPFGTCARRAGLAAGARDVRAAWRQRPPSAQEATAMPFVRRPGQLCFLSRPARASLNGKHLHARRHCRRWDRRTCPGAHAQGPRHRMSDLRGRP